MRNWNTRIEWTGFYRGEGCTFGITITPLSNQISFLPGYLKDKLPDQKLMAVFSLFHNTNIVHSPTTFSTINWTNLRQHNSTSAAVSSSRRKSRKAHLAAPSNIRRKIMSAALSKELREKYKVGSCGQLIRSADRGGDGLSCGLYWIEIIDTASV
jgi:hypothetical protein